MNDVHVDDSRLEYCDLHGVRAQLQIKPDRVVLRIDLPTWEWLEISLDATSIVRAGARAMLAGVAHAPSPHAGQKQADELLLFPPAE